MTHNEWSRHLACIDQKTIFFILGCQKSGTTWVQLLLDSHPEIRCGGEGHIADLLLPVMKQAVDAFNQRQRARQSKGLQVLLSPDDFFHIARTTSDAMLAQYLRDAGRDSVGSRGKIRALGDKTPESAIQIPDLLALYPSARFIHVIRDGRDGAVSGWNHWRQQRDRGEMKNPGQFQSLADYACYYAKHHWVGYIRSARTAAKTMPAEQYAEIKYEDLHKRPEQEMLHLLEFLGVGASPDSIKACVDAASFKRLSGGRERGDENVQSFFRKGVVGDWRDSFDSAALARFEEIAGPLLRELGYKTAEVLV